MQILSYGYLKPMPSDTGDVVFPALQQDIQQLNDHTHDGINSALVAVTTQALLSVNWIALGGGLFHQVVTMPVGFLYDQVDMAFRLSTGEIIYPTVNRLSATTYDLFINDNTLDVTVYYG